MNLLGVIALSSAGMAGAQAPEPASIRVAEPAAKWFACDGSPRFRPSALKNPPYYERRKGALARALRLSLRDAEGMGQATRGWRLLVRTRVDAYFIAGRRGDAFGYMRFEKKRRGWDWAGSGGCIPRAWRDGLEAAPWKLEAPPSPDARQVAVLVHEQACGTGQVLAPWVHYGTERITVTYHVRPAEGFSTCEGRPPHRVVLELEEPVGDRALADGGRPPRA